MTWCTKSTKARCSKILNVVNSNCGQSRWRCQVKYQVPHSTHSLNTSQILNFLFKIWAVFSWYSIHLMVRFRFPRPPWIQSQAPWLQVVYIGYIEINLQTTHLRISFFLCLLFNPSSLYFVGQVFCFEAPGHPMCFQIIVQWNRRAMFNKQKAEHEVMSMNV